ncbi:carboxylesterase family protein, partial [Pseudophaeobacter profundi]|uniref:carboxylesterase family protein n=1 Tax=Pseudophaeobacter profundi TaxID=3034152 RepID=UPI00243105B6
VSSPAAGASLGGDILRFYTDSDQLSWDVMDGYVNFISDVGFVLGLQNTRQALLKHDSKPVYFYLLTYTSLRAFSSFLIPMSYPKHASRFVGSGASHGDELVHQFKTNMSQAPILPPTPDDLAFMKKFIKAWTSFAKTGNPNCEELGKTWKEDSLENPSYLELGKEIKPVEGIVFPERMAFW